MFLMILGGLFLAAGLTVLGLIAGGVAESELALMAIIFVFVGLLNGGIGYAMLVSASRTRRILATGIPGMARLEQVRQTNMTVNNQPVIALTLEVRLPDREPYQVKKRQITPFIQLASLQPGASLPVRVDPKNPRRVVIDWTGARRGTYSTGEAMAAAQAFMGPEFAPRPEPPAIDPSRLDLPMLPPHLVGASTEEQRENVRELGASGRAIVDTVSVVGPVGGKMGYRLGMWVQLDSGPAFRVDNGPATVESQFVEKVVPGVTVPLRMAHVRPGVTMTVLEWDRV